MSRRISSIRMTSIRETAHTVATVAAAMFMIFMTVGAAAFAVAMINLADRIST